MNSKLYLPAALGVSLVTASALLLYYVLKKEEDEEERPAKTEEKSVKSARLNVIEVPVPKSIVPALIGRAGSNIKDIEKKSGASIIFKKFPEKDADICIIRGRTADTQIAETMVHEFIRDQPTIVEDTISVPAWACGRIIGSGGENIKDISHRSGARVKVESGGPGDSTGQRLVNFRGTAEQIQQARELVLELVAHQRCLREIEQSKSPRVPTPVEPEPPETAGSPGGNVEVYVSAVSSPSRFWVQLVGPQTKQLDELVEHMTEYYNNKDNRDLHKLSQVTIGQVVAAVFRYDGRWYRARVTDIKPNEFSPDQMVADVFYLDYGDSEFVATHELCELRADLLRLRFQAMECFLAGVRPAGREEDVVGVAPDGQRWDKWPSKAIARFEQLTKVARWQSLMCSTCTYKKTPGAGGERDKEVPGIQLYDVTDEGEINIGEVLVEEGLAIATPISPRPSPRTPSAPPTPFGDLGASRVLGLTTDSDHTSHSRERSQNSEERSSEEKRESSPPPRPPLPSPASLSYPHPAPPTNHKPALNGTHALLDNERINSDAHKQHADNITPKVAAIDNFATSVDNFATTVDKFATSVNKFGPPVDKFAPKSPEGNNTVPKVTSVENFAPKVPSIDNFTRNDKIGSSENLPLHLADPRDDLKANINRLDSHHNLEALGK